MFSRTRKREKFLKYYFLSLVLHGQRKEGKEGIVGTGKCFEFY